MTKTQLLSPAGNKQSFFSAINNGANAVYLGLTDFSARKNAENFTLDNLKFFVDYAHAFDVEVHLTLNTLIKNNEIDKFFDTAKQAYLCGVDAFIVQDVFLGKTLRQLCPNIKLHLSTQAGVNNVYGAEFAKQNCFDRVVLSRETSLHDIKIISEIIETEVFVQGALCTCFSGQCFFSSFVGGNSGNRGLCKQPCRQLYQINNNPYSYAISLSDLSVGEKIFDLIDAGAVSFKIEGRMRRPEYVASATKYYRDILDGNKLGNDFSLLRRAYNRGDYTLGLGFTQNNIISDKVQNHLGEKIGVITNVKGDCITIKSSHKPCINDCMKILSNGIEVGNATVKSINKTKDGFIANFNGKANVNDVVNITTDITANNRLMQAVKKLDLHISITFCQGDVIKATATVKGKTVTLQSDFLLEKSVNNPITVEEIRQNFNKVDIFPFNIIFDQIITDNVFILKKTLNEFRRNFFEKIWKEITVNDIRTIVNLPKQNSINEKVSKNTQIAVIAENFNFCKNTNIDQAIFFPKDYQKANYNLFFEQCKNVKEKYLFIPPFICQEEIEKLDDIVKPFDGIYFDNLGGFELAKKWNKKTFVGLGLHIFNDNDIEFVKNNADRYVISKELTNNEIIGLTANDGFVNCFGSTQIMNLIYCPFHHNCNDCQYKHPSFLTDKSGRSFTLVRYKVKNDCRFAVYNCKTLLTNLIDGKNLFIDATNIDQIELALNNINNLDKLKSIFSNYTFGHSKNGVE